MPWSYSVPLCLDEEVGGDAKAVDPGPSLLGVPDWTNLGQQIRCRRSLVFQCFAEHVIRTGVVVQKMTDIWPLFYYYSIDYSTKF